MIREAEYDYLALPRALPVGGGWPDSAMLLDICNVVTLKLIILST